MSESTTYAAGRVLSAGNIDTTDGTVIGLLVEMDKENVRLAAGLLEERVAIVPAAAQERPSSLSSAGEEETAKRIAWAHWRVKFPNDMSRDPDHLWENLGSDRAAYLAASRTVQQPSAVREADAVIRTLWGDIEPQNHDKPIIITPDELRAALSSAGEQGEGWRPISEYDADKHGAVPIGRWNQTGSWWSGFGVLVSGAWYCNGVPIPPPGYFVPLPAPPAEKEG
jgi:hypothetical protein